jgi:hypothetical protein
MSNQDNDPYHFTRYNVDKANHYAERSGKRFPSKSLTFSLSSFLDTPKAKSGKEKPIPDQVKKENQRCSFCGDFHTKADCAKFKDSLKHKRWNTNTANQTKQMEYWLNFPSLTSASSPATTNCSFSDEDNSVFSSNSSIETVYFTSIRQFPYLPVTSNHPVVYHDSTSSLFYHDDVKAEKPLTLMEAAKLLKPIYTLIGE